jgi:hypothetical protein
MEVLGLKHVAIQPARNDQVINLGNTPAVFEPQIVDYCAMLRRAVVEINQISGILLTLESRAALPKIHLGTPLPLPPQICDRALQLRELRRSVVH